MAHKRDEHSGAADSVSVLSGFRLDGHVALITGGGRGIGRAIALAYAELGANVAVMARSESEIEAVEKAVRTSGPQGLAITADIRDSKQVADGCKRAAETLGPIDILVNNAGNLLYKPFVPLPGVPRDSFPQFHGETTDEEWASVIGTHLNGAFFVLRETLPRMVDAGYGRIINILSNSLIRHVPFVSAYDTGKGALGALTRSLANEVARYGVTVNAIAPGHFYTALSAPMHDNPDSMRRLLNRIPMRRVGDLHEIAGLAAYLASGSSGFLTGQVIAIDGGESL